MAQAGWPSSVAVFHLDKLAEVGLLDTFAVLGQVDAAHPAYSHWYLPWFAVDTALQGRGLAPS